MPHIGMPTEYEHFLQQSNREVDNEEPNTVFHMPQIVRSNEWISEDTDDEASQMTDISDFSLSDTEDEDGNEDEDENEEAHECRVCGEMYGRNWSSMPNTEMFVCRQCLSRDLNNINDQEIRNWITSLGTNGVRNLIQRENREELINSSVLNPDFDSNYERNHQGVEYLAVETVFELVSHGGFLTRTDFNHLLDIVAYVCHRPEPDTDDHRGILDSDRTLYSSARSSQSPRYSRGEAPLIELLIPCNNDAWSYPSNNTHAAPVEEVHNHYMMSDYPAIVATCAIYMANNFINIHYS